MIDDIKSEVGVFNINTATGNQIVTLKNANLTGKVVIFFPTLNTSDGLLDGMVLAMGAAMSSSNRFAMCAVSQDAVSSTNAGSRHTVDRCFTVLNQAFSATVYSADFVSFSKGSFTINVISAPASSYKVGYLILGGASLSVQIGQLQVPGVEGEQDYTGLGFDDVDCILFASPSITTAPPSNKNGADFMLGIGGNNSKGSALFNYVGSIKVKDNVTPSSASSSIGSKGAACIFGRDVVGAAVDFTGKYVSAITDGFRINWTDVTLSNVYVFYIALKGLQLKVGDQALTEGVGEGYEVISDLSSRFNLGILFIPASRHDIGGAIPGTFSIGLFAGASDTLAVGGASGYTGSDANTKSFLYTNKAAVALDNKTQDFYQVIGFRSWFPDGVTFDLTIKTVLTATIYIFMGAKTIIKDSVGKIVPRRRTN